MTNPSTPNSTLAPPITTLGQSAATIASIQTYLTICSALSIVLNLGILVLIITKVSGTVTLLKLCVHIFKNLHKRKLAIKITFAQVSLKKCPTCIPILAAAVLGLFYGLGKIEEMIQFNFNDSRVIEKQRNYF